MKMGNPTADDILTHGIYEYGLIKWCEQFLSPTGVFVDVGAHMGTYSIILSKSCKKVVSFEAQKNTFDGLNIGICANNRFNIKAYNVALGSKEGTTTLYHVSEDGGGSTTRKEVLRQDVINSEEVQVKTLDSYKLTNIDFMKIDVEGAELDVIKGASHTLFDNNFPPFIFEVWPDDFYKNERDLLITFVSNMGYKVTKLSGCDNMYIAADHPLRVKAEPPPKYDIKVLHDYYKNQEYDKLDEWDAWQLLAADFRHQSKNTESYDCCVRGLEICPDDDKYRFYEELAIVCYYLNRKDEGYDAADKVILSRAPWSSRNKVLKNQSYYMQKLPFKTIHNVDYVLPEKYIGSSSSIIRNGDGYIFNLRSVNYTINGKGGYDIRDPENIVRSRNFMLKMDGNFNVISDVELKDVSGIQLYPKNIRGLEDIRLINDHELFCVYLEANDARTPQMCYCTYEEDGRVTRIIPLSVTEKIQCEKNWLPFEDNGELYFIYRMHPLLIYKLNKTTGDIVVHKGTELSEANIADFRGSANPIPYNGGWLCTIHQVYHDDPRNYFHRFVWFNTDFTEMKYSKVFYFESVNIEYNVSICHSNNGLILAYSIRDNASKIGIVDYATVNNLLGI